MAFGGVSTPSRPSKKTRTEDLVTALQEKGWGRGDGDGVGLERGQDMGTGWGEGMGH